VNRVEAAAIMTAELAKYEALDYAQLVEIVDAPKVTTEIVAPSGVRYFVDIRAWWDSRPSGDIRVSCAIDDGGSSAFLPLTGSFIKQRSH
jgi:hypothetical protein